MENWLKTHAYNKLKHFFLSLLEMADSFKRKWELRSFERELYLNALATVHVYKFMKYSTDESIFGETVTVRFV